MGRRKATACSWKPSRCHRNKEGQSHWAQTYRFGHPSGADVCTIRRSAAHFNRKLPGNGAGVDTIEVPRADLRSNLTTGRFSECPSSGWRCGTRNLHIEFPEEIDAPLR